MTRELKGKHVLIIAVCAFGVIVAANLAMLFAATDSFPGLVVKNSYVASQGWNARTDAQRALNWTTDIAYANGAIELRVTDSAGRPSATSGASLVIGRPSTDVEDQVVALGDGKLDATIPIELAPGVWRITIKSAEPSYQFSDTVFIPENR